MILSAARNRLPLLAAVFLSIACAGAQQQVPAAAPASAPPRLVVLIVVDQLQGDMLTRYQKDLSKGFARLMNGGAWMTDAYQDHAITETAPGHASTMSGRFPAHTGIIANSAGVLDPSCHLINALPREPGGSPLRFQGTTLTDWLTAKDPRTHVLSVSMK